MSGHLNGHAPHDLTLPLDRRERCLMVNQIEHALVRMTEVLLHAGFTDCEVSSVNLTTRHAITSVIKGRNRKP